MIKIFLLIAAITLLLVKWTTTKVCNYNLALEENVKIINKTTQREAILEGEASVIYKRKIDYSKIDASFNYSLDLLLKKIEDLIPN